MKIIQVVALVSVMTLIGCSSEKNAKAGSDTPVDRAVTTETPSQNSNVFDPLLGDLSLGTVQGQNSTTSALKGEMYFFGNFKGSYDSLEFGDLQVSFFNTTLDGVTSFDSLQLGIFKTSDLVTPISVVSTHKTIAPFKYAFENIRFPVDGDYIFEVVAISPIGHIYKKKGPVMRVSQGAVAGAPSPAIEEKCSVSGSSVLSFAKGADSSIAYCPFEEKVGVCAEEKNCSIRVESSDSGALGDLSFKSIGCFSCLHSVDLLLGTQYDPSKIAASTAEFGDRIAPSDDLTAIEQGGVEVLTLTVEEKDSGFKSYIHFKGKETNPATEQASNNGNEGAGFGMVITATPIYYPNDSYKIPESFYLSMTLAQAKEKLRLKHSMNKLSHPEQYRSTTPYGFALAPVYGACLVEGTTVISGQGATFSDFNFPRSISATNFHELHTGIIEQRDTYEDGSGREMDYFWKESARTHITYDLPSVSSSSRNRPIHYLRQDQNAVKRDSENCGRNSDCIYYDEAYLNAILGNIESYKVTKHDGEDALLVKTRSTQGHFKGSYDYFLFNLDESAFPVRRLIKAWNSSTGKTIELLSYDNLNKWEDNGVICDSVFNAYIAREQAAL